MEPSVSILLDEAQVSLMRDLFGESFADMLVTWQETSEADLDRLRAAIAAGRLDEAAEAAHSVKGAALNLGATSLAEGARAVEASSSVPEPAVVDELHRLLTLSVAALTPAS
ncbi:MAG: Hpt domain [Nocardioides sp.]|nr:Hpt domain [Nocardioides sp.]